MGQGVIHEVRGQKLAVFVIDHALEQGPANALNDATVQLTFDQGGIDGKADILNGNIVENTHIAGLWINGDSGDMSGEHGRIAAVSDATTPVNGSIAACETG